MNPTHMYISLNKNFINDETIFLLLLMNLMARLAQTTRLPLVHDD